MLLPGQDLNRAFAFALCVFASMGSKNRLRFLIPLADKKGSGHDVASWDKVWIVYTLLISRMRSCPFAFVTRY